MGKSQPHVQVTARADAILMHIKAEEPDKTKGEIVQESLEHYVKCRIGDPPKLSYNGVHGRFITEQEYQRLRRIQAPKTIFDIFDVLSRIDGSLAFEEQRKVKSPVKDA